MKQLNPDYCEALYLMYFENMSYAQTAQIMGKSIKQIDHLLERGKKRFGRCWNTNLHCALWHCNTQTYAHKIKAISIAPASCYGFNGLSDLTTLKQHLPYKNLYTGGEFQLFMYLYQ